MTLIGLGLKIIKDIIIQSPYNWLLIYASKYLEQEDVDYFINLLSTKLTITKRDALKYIKILISGDYFDPEVLVKIYNNVVFFGPVKIEILNALKSRGSKAVVDLSLDALFSGIKALQLVAIESLGIYGGKSAVGPLNRLYTKSITKPEIRNSALDALNKIKARLSENAEEGWLSMSEAEPEREGTLSINSGETSGLLSMDKSKETGPDSGLEE